MSIIAAVVTENTMHLAADTLSSNEYVKSEITIPKIKLFKGEFLVGCAGRMREQQVACFYLNPPDVGETDLDVYVITQFVPSLIEILQEHGLVKDGSWNSVLLLALRGKLFEVDSYFTVHKSPLNYLAVGSGAEVASGSLHATHSLPIPAEDKLRLAIEACSYHCTGCGGDIDYLEIGVQTNDKG